MKNLVLILLFFSFLFPIAAIAQTTSSRTDIFYDSGNNIVFATASLNPDYSTQYYYGIYMGTYLSSQGYSLPAAEYQGYGPGTTYIERLAQAGYQYMATTFNSMIISYQTYEVIPGCYGCYDWYDSYGYVSFEGFRRPEQEGITFSVSVWAAPIIITRTIYQYLSMGRDSGRTRVPGEKMDFQVLLKSFIPWLYVWGGEPCWDPQAGWSKVIYNGNNRTYSSAVNTGNSKATSVAYLLPDQGGGISQTAWHQVGYTKRYSKETALFVDSLLEDETLHDCYKLDDRGFGGDAMHIDLSGNVANRSATAHFYGDARTT